MTRFDLTGQRFGLLVAVARDGSTRSRHVAWLCRCQCGGETVVPSSALRRGHIRTCGERCPERAAYFAKLAEKRARQRIYQERYARRRGVSKRGSPEHVAKFLASLRATNARKRLEAA